ncbi:collagen alpha-1(I) chain-like [Manis pentadactyla]|uniref:collagen alpha-1(I) chain-like n=1 Tax=Manis pentadactyla TaxID=143292 RepID=UPI00255CCAFF|nr:collagen alpha-1(I) chain-like [Manis pentadactyla]
MVETGAGENGLRSGKRRRRPGLQFRRAASSQGGAAGAVGPVPPTTEKTQGTGTAHRRKRGGRPSCHLQPLPSRPPPPAAGAGLTDKPGRAAEAAEGPARGGWEAGGGRRKAESAVQEQCGEDRALWKVEGRRQKTECRTRLWPQPVGGCARAQAGAEAEVCSSSSRRVQGAAASRSPEAHWSRRGGGSDRAGAGCLVSGRRRRPTRRRQPQLPRLPVLLTAGNTFDFGEIGGLSPPPPTASAHHPPPPPLRATFPEPASSPSAPSGPAGPAGPAAPPHAPGRPLHPQSQHSRGSRTKDRVSRMAGVPALPSGLRVAQERGLRRGRRTGAIPG